MLPDDVLPCPTEAGRRDDSEMCTKPSERYPVEDIRLDSLAVERLLDGSRVWRTGLLHVQSTHLAVTEALRPLLPLLALRTRWTERLERHRIIPHAMA